MSKSPDAFRTISEVAEWLDTPAHVLRFWESKFTQVKPVKRAGGRRYYRPADMELLGGIKRLLHDDGMTIKGVQKILREQGVRHVSALADLPDGEIRHDPVAEAPFAEMAEPADVVVPFAPPDPEPDLIPPSLPLPEPAQSAPKDPADVTALTAPSPDQAAPVAEDVESIADTADPQPPNSADKSAAPAESDPVPDSDPIPEPEPEDWTPALDDAPEPDAPEAEAEAEVDEPAAPLVDECTAVPPEPEPDAQDPVATTAPDPAPESPAMTPPDPEPAFDEAPQEPVADQSGPESEIVAERGSVPGDIPEPETVDTAPEDAPENPANETQTPQPTDGFAADPIDSPVPGFLQNPLNDPQSEDDTPTEPSAPDPVIEAPGMIPDLPDLEAIEPREGVLSLLTRVIALSPEQAQLLEPRFDQLRQLQDRLCAPRKS